MRKTSLFALILCGYTATAQHDSTKFDLGANSADKKFTQHITVKGEDLQRLPFSTIEEAINVYFGGIYNTRYSTAYVIDGNLSETVDGLSIYDIESITLIQNAKTIINGALPSQQLILIETKTGFRKKSGITAAASGFITRRRNPNTDKLYEQDNQTFFQQYYIGGNHVKDKTEFGASLNFLREAVILPYSFEVNAPFPKKMNRFRGHAWFNAQLGTTTILTLRLNVAPQDSAYSFTSIPFAGASKTDYNIKGKNLIIFPSLKLATALGGGWRNELNISYSKVNKDMTTEFFITNTGQLDYSIRNQDVKQNDLIIREQISYEKTIGNWIINPSLNLFSNRRVVNSNFSDIMYRDLQVPGLPSSATSQINNSTAWNEYKDQGLVVSPAAAFSFSNIFYLQGGLQVNNFKKEFLSKKETKIFPFASASFDIAKAMDRDAISVKVYASYAKGNSWKERSYFNGTQYFFRPNNNIYMPDIQFDPATAINLGLGIGSENNKFQFSYNYEKRKYTDYVDFSNPAFPLFVDCDVNVGDHRVSINYNSKKYNGSINVYRKHSEVTVPVIGGPWNAPENQLVFIDGWSGGWANNFKFNRVFLGVNAMYFFDEDISSLLLQHVYLGYNMNIKKKVAEVYLSGRNLLQKKESAIEAGYVSYYGLGVKMEF